MQRTKRIWSFALSTIAFHLVAIGAVSSGGAPCASILAGSPVSFPCSQQGKGPQAHETEAVVSSIEIHATNGSKATRLENAGGRYLWGMTPVGLGQGKESQEGVCIYLLDARELFAGNPAKHKTKHGGPVVMGARNRKFRMGKWSTTSNEVGGVVLVAWDPQANGHSHVRKVLLIDPQMVEREILVPEGGIHTPFVGGQVYALNGEAGQDTAVYLVGAQNESGESKGSLGLYHFRGGELEFTPFNIEALKATYEPNNEKQRVRVNMKLIYSADGEPYFSGVISIDGECGWFNSPVKQGNSPILVSRMRQRSYLPLLVEHAQNTHEDGVADRLLCALQNPEVLAANGNGPDWALRELEASPGKNPEHLALNLVSPSGDHRAPGGFVGLCWLGSPRSEEYLFYANQHWLNEFATKVSRFSREHTLEKGAGSTTIGSRDVSLNPWSSQFVRLAPSELLWISMTHVDYSDRDGHGSLSFIALSRARASSSSSTEAASWGVRKMDRVPAENYLPVKARYLGF